MFELKRLTPFLACLLLSAGSPVLAQFDLNVGGGSFGNDANIRVSPSGVRGNINVGDANIRVSPSGVRAGLPGAGVTVYGGPGGTSANCCRGWGGSGSGNTGAQYRRTDTTWQDVDPVAAPGNVDRGLGRTYYTGTQGQYDLNGPALKPAATGLEAPSSGMEGLIPSGQYNFGFGGGGTDRYRGPYAGARNNGGSLPPTSTSSVNLDVVGGGGGSAPSRASLDGPTAGSTPSWGFPGQGGNGYRGGQVSFPISF